jgi:autotransporter family porin
VVANVTVTNTSAASYLTVWPAGAAQPLASDLNWTASVTVPNLVVVALGPSGSVDVYNFAGSTDLVIDVVGYYVDQGPPAVSPPTHFGTLGPGATLPSGAQCATWVRATPIAENKGVNTTANQVTGQHVGADLFGGDDPAVNTLIAPRIDGQFTGTTHQILRWAACKWGIDEDIVAAQAAIESWWRQPSLGDFGTDPTQCPPGHGLGVDGTPGQCPQSYGILQTRYPYEVSAWPGIGASTAMSADTAYGTWRACFEGYEQWLNTVDRGSQYAAGDAWGCVGRWFSGRWHTAAAEGYITNVKDYLSQRIWETPNFQEP